MISGILWCALIGVGARELHAYEVAPGDRGDVPTTWPAASALPHRGVTVAMFLHPDCPCSRASVSELQAAVASTPAGTLLIVVEDDMPASLAATLRSIPGAQIVVDRDKREAARFGAKTSGHVVAYDATGTLAFAGGITAIRGHRGDNIGRRSLERVLANQNPVERMRSVFGCGLAELP